MSESDPNFGEIRSLLSLGSSRKNLLNITKAVKTLIDSGGERQIEKIKYIEGILVKRGDRLVLTSLIEFDQLVNSLERCLFELILEGDEGLPEKFVALDRNYSRRISHLSFSEFVEEDSVMSFLKSNHFESLVFLDIHDVLVSLSDLSCIFDYGRIPNVKHLALQMNCIGAEGAKFLANTKCMQNVEYFEISDNDIGPLGAESILMSNYFSRSKTMNLSGNLIREESGMDWFGALESRMVEALDLSDNEIASKDIDSILKSSYIRTVVYLNLSDNNLENHDAAKVINSQFLSSLKLIDFRGNKDVNEDLLSMISRFSINNVTILTNNKVIEM